MVIILCEQFQFIINEAYNRFRRPNRCELKNLSNNRLLLELFHGPTYAFKDFAMQMIAVSGIFKKIKKSINIIVATSCR